MSLFVIESGKWFETFPNRKMYCRCLKRSFLCYGLKAGSSVQQ